MPAGRQAGKTGIFHSEDSYCVGLDPNPGWGREREKLMHREIEIIYLM